MRKILLLLEILLISICCLSEHHLQAQCKSANKTGSNNIIASTDTLYFGNNVNATYGYDILSPTWIEFEAPPPGFCNAALWRNIPGRPIYPQDGGMGLLGLFPYDFRGIPAAPLHKDTFALTVVDFDNDFWPMELSWPSHSYLSARSDSMFLVDKSGKIPPVDMFLQDSLVVAPKPDYVSHFYIFKYGVNLVDSAPPPSSSVFWVHVTYRYTIDAVGGEVATPPLAFSLKQNYPNPFNPSTFIGYRLPGASPVTLRMYDILGREVATLVSGIGQPGEYRIQWNAEYTPGGVYFYRLVAGDFVETKKMMVVR